MDQILVIFDTIYAFVTKMFKAIIDFFGAFKKEEEDPSETSEEV